MRAVVTADTRNEYSLSRYAAHLLSMVQAGPADFAYNTVIVQDACATTDLEFNGTKVPPPRFTPLSWPASPSLTEGS